MRLIVEWIKRSFLSTLPFNDAFYLRHGTARYELGVESVINGPRALDSIDLCRRVQLIAASRVLGADEHVSFVLACRFSRCLCRKHSLLP